jgi:hypothetical protein
VFACDHVVTLKVHDFDVKAHKQSVLGGNALGIGCGASPTSSGLDAQAKLPNTLSSYFVGGVIAARTKGKALKALDLP